MSGPPNENLTPEEIQAATERLAELEAEDREHMCNYPDCINRAEDDDTYCRIHKPRVDRHRIPIR